jgi:hypothetical protein
MAKWPISLVLFATLSAVSVLPCRSDVKVPGPVPVPSGLSEPERSSLLQKRSELLGQRDALEQEIKEQQDQCGHINVKDTAKVASCEVWRTGLEERYGNYRNALKGFKVDVGKKGEAVETDPFYAKQVDTLVPMKDGGHPIDGAGSPRVIPHGLVGGTTWTYGFLRPRKNCDAQCVNLIGRKLDEQLALHCKSQDDPEECLKEGLPFTQENYDMVLSMGSYHTAIEDLATRVVWDGQSFGEFSAKHASVFGSLLGRQFDTLDCHSNGAMLCLAALRNPDDATKTTAKKVRLFGPQINAQAADLWREWGRKNPGSEIEIYINNGDPVPAISWKQPTPQTSAGKAATAVWLTTPVGGPSILADMLMNGWRDGKSGVMDSTLEGFGFKVERFHDSESDPPGTKCGTFDVKCHSMLLYEKRVGMVPVKR